jgi:hypothetical protein
MKRIILPSLIFLMLVSGLSVYGQTSIPNSDFETWTVDTYGSDSLSGWSSSNSAMAGSAPDWLYKSTTSNSGTYAAAIGSVGFGFAQIPVNGILVNGTAVLEKLIPDEIVYKSGGGTPISIKPISLNGYYIYELVSSPDHAEGIVVLSKYNQQTSQRDTVGMGNTILNAVGTYTPFSITINDLMPAEMPDTVIVMFYASDKNNVKKLNLLYVDDINLCGPSPLNLGNDTSIMAGESITLDAGNGFSNYLWSDNTTGPTLNATATGEYYVTITDSGNCVYSDTISINVLCPPSTLSLGNDTAISSGQTLILDAGVHAAYLWSNGDTTQTTAITTDGIYDVTVTDSNGCKYSDTISVSLLSSIADLKANKNNLLVFPNPAKDKVSFTFVLKEKAAIEILIYNGLYREVVAVVAGENYAAGKHTVNYNIQQLPAGVYYYKFKSGKTTTAGKLVIER